MCVLQMMNIRMPSLRLSHHVVRVLFPAKSPKTMIAHRIQRIMSTDTNSRVVSGIAMAEIRTSKHVYTFKNDTKAYKIIT